MGRSLFRIGLAIVVAGTLTAIAASWYLANDDGVSRSQAVSEACRDIQAQLRARLRVQARRDLLALRELEDDAAVCGQVNEATLERADRIAATAFVRARIYRRAARLRRAAGLVNGQRAALRRATRAYVTGLRRDPFNLGARKGLTRILAGRLGPGSRDRANMRCRAAARLRRARLLPEAFLVYAQALRTGRTTRCLRYELRRARGQRGTAVAAMRRSTTQPNTREGRLTRRRELLGALALDPSLPSARAALGKAPPEGITKSGFWPRIQHGLRQGFEALNVAAAAIVAHAAGLALALLVLFAVLVLASHALLHAAARSDRVRRRLDVWPSLRRLTRTRILITAEGTDDQALRSSVVATLIDTFQQIPVTTRLPPAAVEAHGAHPTDQLSFEASQPGALEGVATILSGAFPALTGVAAVLKWVPTAIARRELRISCLLLPAVAEGVGLRISLADRRGAPRPGVTLWQSEWVIGLVEPGEAYFELAIVAAEWLRENEPW